MVRNKLLQAGAAGMLLVFSFVGAASAMTATCSGAPLATAITWSGSASGGVTPYVLLWGNGATSSSQTVAAAAGTHSMTFQATDASSTVATTTCGATVTAAATSTDTVVKIQALLAQIKALQAQILQLIAAQVGGSGGTATSTPQGCFGFWRDLKHGDIGDDVKELQQQLAHDDPTLFPPGLVTGFFGPKTEAAVKMFQRRFGIDMTGTGFFGPKSRSHMASLCSNGDRDKDGTVNSMDSDDDNDGTPDTSDAFPFDEHATSTRGTMEDRRGSNGWKGWNGKKGGDDDDDDDDDDD